MSGNSSVCRMCRQVGEKLFLKGARCRTGKCAVGVRQSAPGQHGNKGKMKKKTSEFGKQLQEKQKVKMLYGVREKQFKRFFQVASKQHGVTGETLLVNLERRLDNTMYRLKMALSRIQSKQMIVHGHVLVNGKRVKSPSALIKGGDVITLSERSLKSPTFLENVVDKRINIGIKIPEWLELEKAERKGVVLRMPTRSDITTPIEEHLIVELYSK
jgi:small subunit ribosomal protein S4